jgi:ubiquinone biosynthesis accessory factor UbiJ
MPEWAIDEASRRIVLLLNHVLMQEPEATRRLAGKKGQIALVKWRSLAIKFVVTPAGLLDLAEPAAQPGLTLQVVQESPWDILQAVLRGGKPDVHIEGDVHLAADIHWLAENLRWDVEEDLARIVGDVPARAMGDAGRHLAAAIRQFAAPRSAGRNGGSPA